MANIKYTRLVTDETFQNTSGKLRWLRSQIPVAFLKQQIFLLSIIISSLLLLILTAFFTTDVEYDLLRDVSHELNYGVIVDCGSSGTRAHIFTWRRSEAKSPVRVELSRDDRGKPLNKHITPGLSTLQDNPDGASEYMEPIMNFLSDSIPSDRHLDTTIHFMATAGLRLLDETVQKKIMTDIARDLRVKYNFPRIKCQVITGEYEGAYSWLSLNMNRLFTESGSSPKKSLGMIEMGGASTQVTFELDPETEKAILYELKHDDEAAATFRNEQIKLDLHNNQTVKLFATTFLGLGVNSARESAIDLLARDYLNGTGQLGDKGDDLRNSEISLMDPCLTMGSNEVVLRPLELATKTHQSVGFTIKRQEDTFKVKLEGSGNFLNCLTLLERVIKAIKAEKLNCSPGRPSCPMSLLGSKFIPYERYQFVGLSEMFFTTNEIMNSSGLFDRSLVLTETNKICSTRFNELQKHYLSGAVTHEDRILYECFKASWLLTTLHSNGLKMPISYDNFRTVDRLFGMEIDWTIGAMLWDVFKSEDGTYDIPPRNR